MSSTFQHHIARLSGIAGSRLTDLDMLPAAVVAAAAAVGLNASGAPVIRDSPVGAVVALLGSNGHLVLHARPDEGSCVLDLLSPGSGNIRRGVEVIARRLGATDTAPLAPSPPPGGP